MMVLDAAHPHAGDRRPPLFPPFRGSLLEADENQRVVGQAGDGRDALDFVAAMLPDRFVTDVKIPGFRAAVPHLLSKADATEKHKAFLDRVRERYRDLVSAIDGSWHENKLNCSLSTFGFTISGEPTVEDKIGMMENQLPFAALAFRGKIEQGAMNRLEKASV